MNSKKGAADEIQHLNWIIRMRTALMIFEALVILMLGIVAFYLGSLPKTQPWVIELTGDGNTLYQPDVVKTLDSWAPAEATQRFFLSHYIEELRSVSTDNNINKQNANSIYSRSVEAATDWIGKWYHGSNPIDRSKNEYVLIPLDEMAVVRYNNSRNQWKITWRETSYRNSDKEIFADQQCEAILTVKFYLPDTERRRRENPIGMYVSNIEMIYERSLI